ncbi:MAG: hypothetical protein J6M18_04235 [Actinomycetaceae bacterium]|nr:hypothetical protein [Actinomycetaceae bacterium]
MLWGIAISTVVILVVVGVFFMVFRNRSTDMTVWLADSYDALREDKLNNDDFEVNMRDIQLGDVFSSLPEDETQQMTARDIAQWNNTFKGKKNTKFKHAR